jgi:hypothetical protein
VCQEENVGDQGHAIYQHWQIRGRIEHGERYAQDQGLDVENMRVQTRARLGRLFRLVVAAHVVVITTLLFRR